jgi:hypothetical protein
LSLTLLLPVKHPGNNESVERTPMLARMPPEGDAGAEEIWLARGGVTDDLLGCLVTRDFAALSWYSARQAAMALREGSHERLRCALLAEAIFFAAGREPDDRMLMVSMAVHYYVAEQIGLVPADLFDEIASCLPTGRGLTSYAGSAPVTTSSSRPLRGNWSKHQTGRTSCPPCSEQPHDHAMPLGLEPPATRLLAA